MTTDDPPPCWSDVQLTPFEESDLDIVYRWHNSPNVRDLTMGFRFPVRRDAVSDWLRRARDGDLSSKAIYAIRLGQTLVGSAQLNDIDQVHRRASLGIYVADPKRRGQGVGKMAMSLLLDFAFNGLDLVRVELEVTATNAGAIKLYERLGFVLEGAKRSAYFLNGARHDIAIYGLLRDEYHASFPPEANRLTSTLIRQV